MRLLTPLPLSLGTAPPDEAGTPPFSALRELTISLASFDSLLEVDPVQLGPVLWQLRCTLPISTSWGPQHPKASDGHTSLSSTKLCCLA